MGAPNALARIPWTTKSPMRMDIEIQGLQTLGNYTPPAIAVVEHYDPFKKAVVREFINIGGTVGPTPISIVSGAPPDSGSQLSTGEVKIAVYNIGGMQGAGLPRWISKVGEIAGRITGAINGVAESPNFAVTNIRNDDVDLSKPIPDRPGSFGNRLRGRSSSAAGGSVAPSGSVSPALKPGPSPIPAFRPDAVYSPAGDFFGNFPRIDPVAAAPSPTAFHASGSAAGPRSAGDFHELARGITHFPNGGSKLVGNGPMPAEQTASTSGSPWPDPTVLNLSTAVRVGDTKESALPAANRTFPTLQRISGRSQASIFDTGASAVPFAAPAYPNDVGALPGLRVAAVGVDPMKPTQATAPPRAGGVLGSPSATPLRYLSRRDDDYSPAPVSNAAASAAPFALPGSLKFSGDLANWLAVLAGIDRTNPAQAARSAMDDGRRDSYRADPTQPWFVQGWR
jgi:hypothetical protein